MAVRQLVSKMTLPKLRAEIASCRSCGCRACAIRAANAADRLSDLESVPKEQTEDLSGFDPVLLAVGIRMAKAKKTRVMEPAARMAAGKRLGDLIRFQRTTEGIARMQTQFDRSTYARGRVVRG